MSTFKLTKQLACSPIECGWFLSTVLIHPVQSLGEHVATSSDLNVNKNFRYIRKL